MLSMRKTILLFCAVLPMVACGDIIGLDGYTEGDGTAPDVTTDTGGGDARPDVKVSDAGKDVVVPPSCGTASVCVPALPTGWAWAVYSPDSRPGCATGYSTP